MYLTWSKESSHPSELNQLNCSEIMAISLYILVSCPRIFFHWLISNICAVQFTLWRTKLYVNYPAVTSGYNVQIVQALLSQGQLC